MSSLVIKRQRQLGVSSHGFWSEAKQNLSHPLEQAFHLTIDVCKTPTFMNLVSPGLGLMMPTGVGCVARVLIVRQNTTQLPTTAVALLQIAPGGPPVTSSGAESAFPWGRLPDHPSMARSFRPWGNSTGHGLRGVIYSFILYLTKSTKLIFL